MRRAMNGPPGWTAGLGSGENGRASGKEAVRLGSEVPGRMEDDGRDGRCRSNDDGRRREGDVGMARLVEGVAIALAGVAGEQSGEEALGRRRLRCVVLGGTHAWRRRRLAVPRVRHPVRKPEHLHDQQCGDEQPGERSLHGSPCQ